MKIARDGKENKKLSPQKAKSCVFYFMKEGANRHLFFYDKNKVRHSKKQCCNLNQEEKGM